MGSVPPAEAGSGHEGVRTQDSASLRPGLKGVSTPPAARFGRRDFVNDAMDVP